MTGVVVVGTGIAGVRAAEALSASGYRGEITLLGDEAPVYRPSISKEALTLSSPRSFPMPMRQVDNAFTWKLGSTVQGVDLAQQTLTYRDSAGSECVLGFEALVIASGLRPRKLPVAGPAAGRYFLRTLAQAEELAHQLQAGARITIVGSGFIGCEVAAAAQARGCAVTVISPELVPLASAVGQTIGQIVTRSHLERGVQFRLGQTVMEYRGDSSIREVVLDDGHVIQTDLVLEAVGSQPNVDWLTGQGLETSDGVLTDGHLRVLGTTTVVFACGDVARYPNALYSADPRRIEHWTCAADTGTFAGKSLGLMLEGVNELPLFAALPAFWSDQYDMQIQSFGIPQLATGHTVVELNDDGSCIIECTDTHGLVAVVGINRTAELARYRKSLNSRL